MTCKCYTKDYKKAVKCPANAPICADCGPPKHPCPQGIIINCCTGTGVNTGFIVPPLIPPPEVPVPLVCTTLDTTCLCRPVVKIEFDCNVFFTVSEAAETALILQLKKSCNNGQEIVCGTWSVTRNNVLGSASSDSFAFAFCDSNPCPGCCTYVVEIISFEVEEDDQARIFINAPTLKGIAMETCGVPAGNGSPDTSLYKKKVTEAYGNQEMRCPPAAPVCADCEPKHPCPQGAIFNCCTGSDIPNTSVCPTVSRPLVCVTIDTTCLCRPLVTLDFSAVIAATNDSLTFTTLIFQLKKSCENGQEIECGSWTFERSVNVPSGPLINNDSFRFTFCDCNPCPDCCTYSVTLASCTLAAVNGGQARNFSIHAPTAAVLAVDTCPPSS